MNIVVKFLASIILVIIAVLGFVYSGMFNVSTQWEDPAVLRWMMIATREASIESHAKNIKAPILGSATQIENGFRSYREMCAVCHTPPSGSDSPIKQGLNPPPPDLAEAEDHAMSNAELFWVIKNGIRMTGMPAWGPSHDDAEIWDIVAFLKALPTIDANEYKRLDAKVSKGHGDSKPHVDSSAEQVAPATSNHGHAKEPLNDHASTRAPAPSTHRDVLAHESAPIEYINNGTHAH